MSEVKIVRVHSGEELIGQVTETDTGIHIDKPAIIIKTEICHPISYSLP